MLLVEIVKLELEFVFEVAGVTQITHFILLIISPL